MMRTRLPARFLLLTPLLFGVLGGCAVGPDFVRPSVELPENFQQAAAVSAQWQPFPADAGFSSAEWWKVFNDPILNQLQSSLLIDNQNIRIAEAQYRAARAATDTASAAYYPAINGTLGGTRAENALTTSSTGSSSTTASNTNRAPVNTVTLSATASWELDVWGRIRRNNEAAGARLEASAADLAAARLSAQALLTQAYFQMRSAQQQVDMLSRTVAAYERSLTLIRHRREAGVASPLDVSNGESQLATARATLASVQLLRAQYEHAVAVLVGKAPANLPAIDAADLAAQPPVPELIPSAWLANRPDIIAAERRVAAANAQIGVATAAWFPSLTLSGSYGYRNNSMNGLIDSPHRFWSIGPALALALFDAGARRAAVASAEAGYDQSVATYRQTVLTALQEVEDNMAAASFVGTEKREREVAAKAATRSREIAEAQYAAGTSSQLELSTAQANELAALRTLIDARQRHLLAAVQLYKNLGGQLPQQPAEGNTK